MSPIVILSLLFVSLVSSYPEYYWRPFRGEIPSDAFGPFNTAYHNYIGRAPYRTDGALIGEIFRGNNFMTAVTYSGNVAEITDNILILCTNHSAGLTWTATTSTAAANVPGKVEGGYETSSEDPLSIGRVASTLRIGKIRAFSGADQILQIADSEEGVITFNTGFEVLVSRD